MNKSQFRRVAIVALLLMAGAGLLLAGQSYLLQWWPDPESNTNEPASNAKLKPPSKAQEQSAALDIVRISPDGGSVIAGRGKPGTKLSVAADGQVIGIVDVDDSGSWMLSTNHKFQTKEPSIKLTLAKPGDKVIALASDMSAKSAPPSYGESRAEPETEKQMSALKDLITAARKQVDEQEQLKATQAPKNSKTEAKVAAVQVPTMTATARSLPVPIGFVYREASFTPSGEKAAELLLEYLKVKKLDAVTLTGHADEVGTDEFNMELSRQRLETVRKFLVDGGFTGRFVLVPKGETEPYRGVDRSQFSLDALHQLDRRVEIVLR